MKHWTVGVVLITTSFTFCENNHIRLGSQYGGWVIPSNYITSESICYCVGAGEDISFDLELIAAYNCKVYSFDPTPRSVQHIHDTQRLIEQKGDAATCHGYLYPKNPHLFNNYFFQALALWDEDGAIEFFMPQNSSHVSHSIVNLQKTNSSIFVPCKRLASIMNELGHTNLDLLKMDIEGAEYAVLADILKEHISPAILCIEFHAAHNGNIQKSVHELAEAGYAIFNINNKDYTFIKKGRCPEIQACEDSHDIRSNNQMVIQSALTELFARDSVTTEKIAYELLKENPLACACTYVAIPWAVLINTNKLNKVPALQCKGGCTVCQHIQFEKIIPTLKKMGIQTLFTPHVCKGKKYSGITVLPFPHYAVNGIQPAAVKDIWFSFIGFDTHKTRREIFKIANTDNIYIKERRSWHFSTDQKRRAEEKKEYQDVLSRSRFSLCPRGTGASTLRFWESLQAGAIPVLIADAMTLPEGVNWNECIIQIPESDVSKIKEILSLIPADKEDTMRANCLKAYEEFSGPNFISPIKRLCCPGS